MSGIKKHNGTKQIYLLTIKKLQEMKKKPGMSYPRLKKVFYNLAFVIHSTEFRKNSTSIYFYDIFRHS